MEIERKSLENARPQNSPEEQTPHKFEQTHSTIKSMRRWFSFFPFVARFPQHTLRVFHTTSWGNPPESKLPLVPASKHWVAFLLRVEQGRVSLYVATTAAETLKTRRKKKKKSSRRACAKGQCAKNAMQFQHLCTAAFQRMNTTVLQVCHNLPMNPTVNLRRNLLISQSYGGQVFLIYKRI